MRLLFIVFLLVCINSFGQSSRRSQGILYGIGAQAFDPTGFNLQFFRGFFNNNNSSFATYGVLELGVGKENMIGIVDEIKYADGYWKEGGVRVDVNYLYPVFTMYAPFVLQTYVGAGLQTGTRLYDNSAGEQSKFATGANLMLRLEYVSHGIDLGRAVWFFSIYGDMKFHADFTETFDYVTPGAGIRLRKGR